MKIYELERKMIIRNQMYFKKKWNPWVDMHFENDGLRNKPSLNAFYMCFKIFIF